jgi:hypothetical protein
VRTQEERMRFIADNLEAALHGAPMTIFSDFESHTQGELVDLVIGALNEARAALGEEAIPAPIRPSIEAVNASSARIRREQNIIAAIIGATAIFVLVCVICVEFM